MTEPAVEPERTARVIPARAVRFGTIIADPPWNYTDTSKTRNLSSVPDSAAKLKGYSDTVYDPLSTKDLCALPVGDLATDDAVLLLWTTFPFVQDALDVVKAWGFTYVTGIGWLKADPNTRELNYGVGFWFRGAMELVLVGRRQKAYRSQFIGLGSDSNPTGFVERRLTHSRKPESLHTLAEATYPGPRLELFARGEPRPGWTILGDEAHGDGRDIRDSVPALGAAIKRTDKR